MLFASVFKCWHIYCANGLVSPEQSVVKCLNLCGEEYVILNSWLKLC